MTTYEDIARANSTLKPIDVKGKSYAPVTERIKAFRMIHPEGSISTELVSVENGICIFRAVVTNSDGQVLGTGTAYEKESSSYINKTSYIENCETSAVGRALGMAGYGIDGSMASAEELLNAMKQQEEIKKAEAQTEKQFGPDAVMVNSTPTRLAAWCNAHGLSKQALNNYRKIAAENGYVPDKRWTEYSTEEIDTILKFAEANIEG